MPNQPKVSIITPSYNQGRFLDECIQSVLGQDYPNIEYIIIDGGSADGSPEIIRKYADRLFYWVSEPDGGQSAALNKGLLRATGDIWAWMNSDDAYLPGAVRKAVEWLVGHPDDDIVFGDCLTVNEAGQAERSLQAGKTNFPAMLTGRINIPSGSAFLRRSVRGRVGDFDEGLHYLLDSDYWLRAMQQTCSFGYIPEALSFYRVYPGAKTWDMAQSKKRGQEVMLVHERFWSQSDIPAQVRHLRARSLANAYLYAAHLACQVNDRDLCWYYVRKSMGQGLPAVCPRLARLLLYLLFGRETENFLQKTLLRR